MKKKCSKVSDEDGSLCCCEYINRHGERTHMLASCCDCEDVDEACDRCLKGKSISAQNIERALDTIYDRLRVPWLLGTGAKKIDVTILPPLIFLPIFLHVAALHFFLALVILTSLPILVLWYYYVTHQKKGHTLFFLSLGLFSLGYMYYLFVTEIMPRGTIDSVHLTVLTSGLVLTLVSLAQAKKDPGYLRADNETVAIKDAQSNSVSSHNASGTCHIQPVGWDTPSKLNHYGHNGKLQMDQNEFKKDWCAVCKILRTPRSGHCRICTSCVQRLDHHCVCLTLSTVCRGQIIFTALFYCPGVYKEHSTALSFTCVWYCTIVTAGMGYLFFIQLINISCNITERETRLALRDKTGDKYLCGLIIKTDEYNRGLINNWKEFLQLQPNPPKPRFEDLV
ncbi:palmitoyltransferase ZDHHC23-B isoform X2 [Narcine bancroftii]|uniref:palmitoyltransferase ZDHHC23-B isoform X2 n=1 Tax=Narcine bancroftii TaxID=1343680 RepID=UPI0038311DFE